MTTALSNAPLGDGSSPLNGEVTQLAGQQAPVAAVETPPVAPVEGAAPVVADPTKPVLADPAKAAEAEKATAITTAEKALAEAKTPEEKATAEKALAELKDTPGVAPEKYETFALPEGVTADAAQHEQASELFKSLSLSQLQAQKLVDYTVARDAQNAKTAAEAQVTAYNQLLESRLSELKADKEIGGLNYDQTVADARAFMTKFGTPGLQKYFNESDAGSHVELIRAMSKAGRAISDDKLVLGNGAVPAVKQTPEYVMYPSMRPKS